MPEILMPQLSDSMESGLLLAWLIEDGQPVAVGDELLEIETDKATMAVSAEVAGVLDIVVAAGSTVTVGEVVARVSDGTREPAAAVTESAEVPTPSALRTPEPAGVAASPTREPLHDTVAPAVANGNGGHTRGDTGGQTGPATPVARRLARLHGVHLDGLEGSGPRGRITKEDVLRAAGIAAVPPVVRAPDLTVQAAPPPPVRSPQPEPAPPGGGTQPLTRLQQVVARRMSEAKATVPHFQVQTEVVMDAALALRAELKQAAPEGAPAPSVNDLIVKASALALARHPLANGFYTDDGFELHSYVNVGVAVAAAGALVVVTIPDTDRRSLGEIARDTRALAEKVRSATISPTELSRATFTVSNLGMFGMTAITPVINPPQAAILGVGAVRQVLARVDGEIIDRSLVTLTLSCDHRILYGADASRFLAEIQGLLERPFSLCL